MKENVLKCKLCGNEIKLNAFGKVPNQNRGEQGEVYCNSCIPRKTRERDNEKRIERSISKKINKLI